MKRFIAALVVLGIVAIAVPNLVPLSGAEAEIDDCLAIRPPATLGTLEALYGEENIQVSKVHGGSLFVVTPSEEYVRAASSGILAFVPEGTEEASWVRCTDGHYAFGEDEI